MHKLIQKCHMVKCSSTHSSAIMIGTAIYILFLFLMFQVFLSDLVYHYLESYQPLITKIKQEMYILDILVTLD